MQIVAEIQNDTDGDNDILLATQYKNSTANGNGTTTTMMVRRRCHHVNQFQLSQDVPLEVLEQLHTHTQALKSENITKRYRKTLHIHVFEKDFFLKKLTIS